VKGKEGKRNRLIVLKTASHIPKAIKCNKQADGCRVRVGRT
jgi:hypothetical protein